MGVLPSTAGYVFARGRDSKVTMPIHFASFRNFRDRPSNSDDDESEQDEGTRCGDSQVSASHVDEDECLM